MWKYSITIKTVEFSLLALWLKAECKNTYKWNTDHITWNGGVLTNKNGTKYNWQIIIESNQITVHSNMRNVSLHKGLRFNMISGRLQIS